MEKPVSEIRKFVAPEFMFGRGAINCVLRSVANVGCRRFLLVTDPGVTAAGWPSRVTAQLKQSGIDVHVFSEVASNPPAEDAYRGAQEYRQFGCDGLLSVGGGSPTDCAKAIGVLISNPSDDVLEYAGIDEIEVPIPPLVCIPTTCSGADVSQFAIITDAQVHKKMAIVSKAIVPDLSIIDADTLGTLPPDLLADTVIDAFSHALEAYVSNAHSAVSDIFAFDAIKSLSEGAPVLLGRRSGASRKQAGENVMLGALEAGIAFSNASLGAIHALAHAAGGFFGMPHGACNRKFLASVARFNFDAAADRYRNVAALLGVDPRALDSDPSGELAIQGIVDFVDLLSEKQTCGPFQVTPAEIHRLAKAALEDPCMATNPKTATLSDIETIYGEALAKAAA